MQTPAQAPSFPPELLTVAESSDYSHTGTSDDVEAMLSQLASRSSHLRLDSMGKSSNGRDIPIAIVANPPIETAQQARESGRLILFIMANIHAGEVCGKEASLMLLRELALDAQHPLLKKLVIVVAPNYNADGNDHFDEVAKHRPGQAGPKRVGTRANAEGRDLNRDYIKLEAPETRALVKLLNDWQPHITIDCHATNGSRHRYTLTFDVPLNPSGHPSPIALVRDELLPSVRERLRDRTGYQTFFYGNFAKKHTVWQTYSPLPRFGGPYQGLRNEMSILLEAYSYAPFRDRVLVTREIIRDIMEYASEHTERIIETWHRARFDTIAAGNNPQPDDAVGIRHRPAAWPELVTILGYEEPAGEDNLGQVVPPAAEDTPRDYQVVHLGRFEATRSVRRPYAYIIERGQEPVLDNLRAHGIIVERYNGNATVESATVGDIKRAERKFEGHFNVLLETVTNIQQMSFEGAHLVRTAQPLGNLIVYLLEPESEDGLAAWNFFDKALSLSMTLPVHRVRHIEDLGR